MIILFTDISSENACGYLPPLLLWSADRDCLYRETFQPSCYRDMKAFVQRYWRDVRVGDFVELECDEVIPADILLLASTDPHHICYIETANIDGETNLKQRQIVPGTVDNMLPLVSGG